jgi:hypothetical protein
MTWRPGIPTNALGTAQASPRLQSDPALLRLNVEVLRASEVSVAHG